MIDMLPYFQPVRSLPLKYPVLGLVFLIYSSSCERPGPGQEGQIGGPEELVGGSACGGAPESAGGVSQNDKNGAAQSCLLEEPCMSAPKGGKLISKLNICTYIGFRSKMKLSETCYSKTIFLSKYFH